MLFFIDDDDGNDDDNDDDNDDNGNDSNSNNKSLLRILNKVEINALTHY